MEILRACSAKKPNPGKLGYFLKESNKKKFA